MSLESHQSIRVTQKLKLDEVVLQVCSRLLIRVLEKLRVLSIAHNTRN